MIKEIGIQNFKSVQDLKLALGRFNVFIGANGCGKSNILEAITFGAAAMSVNLSNEFLATRGIRMTEPNLMFSAFDLDNSTETIKLSFSTSKKIDIEISRENDEWKAWNKKMMNKTDTATILIREWQTAMTIKNFMIFSPENYFLRNVVDEHQIKPLGIRGEGLFRHLATMGYKNPAIFDEIKEGLQFIEWFDDLEFDMTSDGYFTGRIKIKDIYLEDGIKYFDARSANEGFLYLLFYLTLFISAETPQFFAIDNIDNALNPKLASDLMQLLAKLASKYNKQVIFTTHNPAILDGLNLSDDEQRLFVINRNAVGHTKALRIEKKTPINNNQPTKLSEQFLRGYIGGLNF